MKDPQDTKCIDIMVDIETLGTEAGNVILSIGACRFDRTLTEPQLIDPYHFHEHLALQPQVDDGLTINLETMRWWMMQSTAARMSAFYQPDSEKHYPRSALELFQLWCCYFIGDGGSTITIWSNTKMDIVMLEYMFEKYGVKLPWRYNQFREGKSFMAGPEYHEEQQIARGVLQESWLFTEEERLRAALTGMDEMKHNALYDAKEQACWVLSGFKYIQEIGGEK